MNYFVAVVLFFITICCSNFSFAGETWEFVPGIKESDIKEISIRKGVFYIASPGTLYRSEDDGKTWETVFFVRGDTNSINFINTSEEGFFVCTKKGVFKSGDGRSNWKRIFKGIGVEQNNTLFIISSKDNKIYLGTGEGLFVSDDKGLTWNKDVAEVGGVSIKWISFLEKEIFVASEKGVYKNSNDGWKRIFVTSVDEKEYDYDLTDEAIAAEKPVNSILNEGKRIFLATDDGIFFSEDEGGNWNRFESNGLGSSRVKRLLFKDNLYAATDRGIFAFYDKGNLWKPLYKGINTKEIQSISLDDKGYIWAGTKKGLYKSKLEDISSFIAKTQVLEGKKCEVLEMFKDEPAIRDVQKAAIDYAEVHPDKIKEWRESARKKALLPDVSVGLDRYVTDLYHWDAGQNPDVLQRGNDAVSWDVTMTWDLGELIWNDDQTSIDTRSRLMVQLRDDILDEVTRTYFERRRLQIETELSPNSDLKDQMEKELRMQELTADLDALTGGYFSN